MRILYSEKILLRDVSMEMWDIYDCNHQKTGRTINRHTEYTQKEEYHLGAVVCIINEKQDFLLQQRSFNKKTYPGKWSLTGGAVLSGENAKEGAIREVFEELNIDLSRSVLVEVGSYIERNVIIDAFVAQVKLEDLDIKIQAEELVGYRWFSLDEVNNLLSCGEIAGNATKAIQMSLAYLK